LSLMPLLSGASTSVMLMGWYIVLTASCRR
jgi:hypothetical protein